MLDNLPIMMCCQWQYGNCSFIHRLVGGLASEKVRWAESVEQFKQEELTLAGDVLLTSSYLSYVGCFGRPYRLELLEDKWMPFLASLDVRMQFCATVHVLLCCNVCVCVGGGGGVHTYICHMFREDSMYIA